MIFLVFLPVSVLIGIVVTKLDVLPKFDIIVKHELNGCQDSIVPMSQTNANMNRCASGQRLVLSQTLNGNVYVICSCTMKDHGVKLEETLPTLPNINNDDAGTDVDEEIFKKELDEMLRNKTGILL